MQKKFKITYSKYSGYYSSIESKLLSVEIEASSKYDAKSKFYKKHPVAEIVKVEEAPDEE